MYGKRRITLTQTNQIVLAGKNKGSKGGSWNPIGVYSVKENKVTCRFLQPQFKWERKLSDEYSILKEFKNKKELREFITNLYKEEFNV